MADFSALVNELKQNNQSEETRDQRRLNQATAHNQDQQERFIGIAEVLAESSEKTSAGLQAVVDGQPQQLSPTQELENKRAEMNIFEKMQESIEGQRNAFTKFFKDYGGKAREFGIKSLKGFAFGLFLIGVLKFLQSDLFKTLLDKVQDFLVYFDNFGEKLNTFLKDPSFGNLVDLFGASGPILLALGALFVLLNPLTTLTFLTKGITKFVGMFTKGGLIANLFSGDKGVNTKLGKKGIFQSLRGGVTTMIDGIKNIGGKIAEQGARFGSKALNVAGSALVH